MFTNTYLPHVGGVARSVSTFEKELRKSGHQVRVIAPTFPEQGEVDEVDVVRVPAIQNFNGSDFSVRIPLPGLISEAIDDFSPDIIHSHHPFLLGDAALRAARTFKIPLVFTHHTLYERYTHYVPLDSQSLQRFVIKLATEYANLCNHVIAPSSSVKTLLQERGVQSKVTVLPTGIDVDYFANGDRHRIREEHGIEKDAVVIGHVGRLAAEKNLPYLAGAISAALKQDERMVCLIAGSGDSEEEIKASFRAQDLENRLIMPGSLSGQALADCYATIDLFCFASTSETQGLVLAEAMAASTPVVALKASGVNDVLVNDVNGIMLAEDTDEEQFSEAILTLLADPEKFRRMKTEAYETAKKFAQQKCCADLINLYTNTIENKIRAADVSEIDLLDNIVLAIQAEWELLQQKTAAVVDTLSEIEP